MTFKLLDDEEKPLPPAKGERRPRCDGHDARTASFQEEEWVAAVPVGFTLDTWEEQEFWRQVTSARRQNDWRDYDLVIAAKIVKLEAEIRELTQNLETEGYTIEDRFGAPKENPMYGTRRALQTQQLQLASSISLGVGGNRAASMNEGGRKRGRPPGASKKPTEGGSVISLLAG